MTDDKPVDSLLDDLESLQDLLDEELEGLDIPVLSEVVTPDDPSGTVAPASIIPESLELDFEHFEVEEDLLADGLGLAPDDNPTSEQDVPLTLEPLEPTEPAGKIPAAKTVEQQLVLPPVEDLNRELGLEESGPEPSPADGDRERLVAEVVDQCLEELEELLRPRLEQLCRELLDSAPTTRGEAE